MALATALESAFAAATVRLTCRTRAPFRHEASPIHDEVAHSPPEIPVAADGMQLPSIIRPHGP